MKTLFDEKGFIKPLLTILILIFLVYAGFQFAVPYYKYTAFKSEVKELARISLGREDKLRSMLNNAINEYNVPVEFGDVYVTRMGKNVRVRISWEDEVDILGIYQKNLFFDIDVTE